jgi:hypothetical protein
MLHSLQALPGLCCQALQHLLLTTQRGLLAMALLLLLLGVLSQQCSLVILLHLLIA